ncbi:hypothetical protein E2C01_100910 [Portunus trituberculatus]|uniref:Uncharacterized protein n=1 Tax=Portunus trituberculatus TaxID=210409 RepID=A0A5B7KJ42_PORTR|nr:hypothetical protein [Portunus trituberculatus]
MKDEQKKKGWTANKRKKTWKMKEKETKEEEGRMCAEEEEKKEEEEEEAIKFSPTRLQKYVTPCPDNPCLPHQPSLASPTPFHHTLSPPLAYHFDSPEVKPPPRITTLASPARHKALSCHTCCPSPLTCLSTPHLPNTTPPTRVTAHAALLNPLLPTPPPPTTTRTLSISRPSHICLAYTCAAHTCPPPSPSRRPLRK